MQRACDRLRPIKAATAAADSLVPLLHVNLLPLCVPMINIVMTNWDVICMQRRRSKETTGSVCVNGSFTSPLSSLGLCTGDKKKCPSRSRAENGLCVGEEINFAFGLLPVLEQSVKKINILKSLSLNTTASPLFHLLVLFSIFYLKGSHMDLKSLWT